MPKSRLPRRGRPNRDALVGRTGEKVKSYKVSSQVRFQPAIENGKIYVSTQDGKVICVDTGDAKFTGWSCWGGNAGHTGLPKEVVK